MELNWPNYPSHKQNKSQSPNQNTHLSSLLSSSPFLSATAPTSVVDETCGRAGVPATPFLFLYFLSSLLSVVRSSYCRPFQLRPHRRLYLHLEKTAIVRSSSLRGVCHYVRSLKIILLVNPRYGIYISFFPI